jgi:hypothetical protein
MMMMMMMMKTTAERLVTANHIKRKKASNTKASQPACSARTQPEVTYTHSRCIPYHWLK